MSDSPHYTAAAAAAVVGIPLGIQVQSSVQECFQKIASSLKVDQQYPSVVVDPLQQHSLATIVASSHDCFSLQLAAGLLCSFVHSLNPLKMW